MTEKYIDPTASGANDGSTKTDAWQSLQTAIDDVSGGAIVAGDVVLCKHTGIDGAVDETLGASIDFDGGAGDLTTGYIKFIGTDPSWIIDGTKYVIDGNSTAARNCYLQVPYIWLENFEGIGGTSANFAGSSTADWAILLNCISHDGVRGYSFATTAYYTTLILCKAYDNSNDGIDISQAYSSTLFCSSYNNTQQGFQFSSTALYCLMYGCLSHNNTTYGLNGPDVRAQIINCILDDEDTGLLLADHYNLLIGNRITNNTTGINFNSKMSLAGWNHFYNSATADISNGTLAYNIPYREALTNHLLSDGIDGTNTVDTGSDDGYNNRATDDFNLKAGAENRRIEVDLEVGS